MTAGVKLSAGGRKFLEKSVEFIETEKHLQKNVLFGNFSPPAAPRLRQTAVLTIRASIMGDRPPNIARLIKKAKRGDRRALNDLLACHRNWLKVFVSEPIGQHLQGRFDDSDVIQKTCAAAFQQFEQFHGTSPGEFQAWLRRIHDRNQIDFVRAHENAGKRTVHNEQTVANVADIRDRDVISPSSLAAYGEDATRLAEALASLPADQREAIRLRYIEDLSLEELSLRLDRSTSACGGLLKRGLKSLRQLLSR